jgi:hypothetical protein
MVHESGGAFGRERDGRGRNRTGNFEALRTLVGLSAEHSA